LVALMTFWRQNMELVIRCYTLEDNLLQQ